MKKVSASFVTGAIALVFAVLGYQTALLVHYSATARVLAGRDSPDTVYVECPVAGTKEKTWESGGSASGAATEKPPSHTGSRCSAADGNAAGTRKHAPRPARVEKLRRSVPPRQVETFRFNPNTASVEELMRLGFSPKQAQSIENYRNKGGRFRRKEDFASSYVVSDSVYARLEAYIDIPLLDINSADSAAFDTLPGIGGYFAARMVEYRTRLHGYSSKEQLMEIRRFDRERYEALEDLITVGPAEPYPFWSLPADSLCRHPYVGSLPVARGIVFFREHNPPRDHTIKNLAAAGVISQDQASKLEKCRLR